MEDRRGQQPVARQTAARPPIQWSRWLKGLAVGAVTALVGIVLGLSPLGTDFEKEVGLSWLFNIRGPIQAPSEVVVVAINERAAGQIGLPPKPRDWHRSIHGELVSRLMQRGASVIVFDVAFTLAKDPKHDRAFARAVDKSDRVLLVELGTGKRQPLLDAKGKQIGLIWKDYSVPPIPILADAAAAVAPFPVPKVQVNIFQFWTFKPSLDDAATMPVAALQLHADQAYDQWVELLKLSGVSDLGLLPKHKSEIKNARDLRSMMRITRRVFLKNPGLQERLLNILESNNDLYPDNRNKDLLRALVAMYGSNDNQYLNFYGPPGSIINIPYNEIITGRGPTLDEINGDLTGKVVFVGYSDLFDPHQPDRFYTVFTREDGVDLSGVEIAATAFGNLLTGRVLKPTGTLATLLILLGLGLLMGTGIYAMVAVVGVPLSILTVIAYGAGAQWIFNQADIWMPLAVPILVQFPLALFTGLLAHYLIERRKQQRYSKAVSYYLPDKVVDELALKEIDPDSLNKVVYGICFATDMSGFTTISQSMSPTELAKFMNSYFDALAESLKEYHVDVTEFHADTIMCAWTANSPEELNRMPATLAALAAVQTVEEFDARTPGHTLNARIGLDEGSFYLGHTGGGGRLGYSILGDCANTASRLEGLNKHLGTRILASQPVVEGAKHLQCRPVGQFLLVGKTEPVAVVEILGDRRDANERKKNLVNMFAEAMQLFCYEQWDTAAEQFASILKEYPDDGPAKYYLALSQEYKQQPPDYEEPWVIRMNKK